MTCVKAATEEDRALEAQVKAMFPHLMNRGLLKPSGELTPRFACHMLTFFRALWQYTELCEMKLGQSPIRHASKKELSIVLRKQNMRQ